MSALTRSTPSAQGTDARGVIAFLDALEGAAKTEPHGVMLLRHGKVIAEGWWEPYAPDRLHHLYSLSKMFTGTAAGLACAEGLLDLDMPVISYFPELDAEITDVRSRSILVRHVASMSAGHTTEQWDRAVSTDPQEPVRGFLLEPPDGMPGVTFAYSQSTTFVLASIIQRMSGQSLVDYLRPRLFDPLGIGEVYWLRRPDGKREIGFAGLHATTEDVARLGQLYLQDGVWEGRQLLAPEWVAEATRKQVDNSGSGTLGPDSDWTQGYGFQFWMSRHGYRGDGAYGQYCLVLPDHDVVLAMTADSGDMQAVLDAAWTHLLPAFERGGSADADAALERRLTGLRLPFPEGPSAAAGAAGLDGEDIPAGEFAPARSVLNQLQRITLTQRALTLHEKDGTATSVPLVAGAWSPVTGHLSARAVRTDADTVTVHLQFVQSPHKLLITCDLRTGTFNAKWRTYPLGAVSKMSLAALTDPASRVV